MECVVRAGGVGAGVGDAGRAAAKCAGGAPECGLTLLLATDRLPASLISID